VAADPLFDLPPAGDTDLVEAARTTIEALREQNAIQPWHELDCAIVVTTADSVGTARGIAKSNMITALLAARAKLPEPVITEDETVVQYEADRELQWIRRHAPERAADVQDAEEPAPV
jgi:hypothetical protein